MQRDVTVREVGPRDGLQNVETFFPTEAKLKWIAAAAEAGVPAIEVCSFVPAKVIAQFTDAGEVVAHALKLPGLEVSALIPNLKGAERGFEAGAHQLNFVVSVSESHNRNNVRRTRAESMEDFARIVALRDSRPRWRGVKLVGGLSTSFGCTFEGRIDPGEVLRMAERFAELGADGLGIADTVGYANPEQVRHLFRLLDSRIGGLRLSAHFHDTRGLGLANVCAALEAGVRVFDASLCGLGGCPFAPGATGNIVTEDLVFMLEAMGLATGIDLDRLIEIRSLIAEHLPEEPLHGTIARAGPPKGFAAARTEESTHV